MAYNYAKYIAEGLKTFAQVPKHLQPQVKQILADVYGIDENGNPILKVVE